MIKAIKGVKDLLPEETPRWRLIEETARRWALRYGFQEIRVPIFETTTLFARSIGATTDIVEKEMYTFPDRDGSSLTLRPKARPARSEPSSNTTVRRIRDHKSFVTSARCFAMNDLKPGDCASFINSASNRSACPIREPMWRCSPSCGVCSPTCRFQG